MEPGMLVAILVLIKDSNTWHENFTYFGKHASRTNHMKPNMHDTAGIQQIVNRYKALFRVPENLNFYSREDLLAAERKFLKYAIMNGGFESLRAADTYGRHMA
jgi:hypothetical protein